MTDFPDALRVWRRARRFSQLELAAEANVSARRTAEAGRPRPSPATIVRLREALQIPSPARDRMLTLAGFATRYPARQWDASEMAPVRAVPEHTLAHHAPFPGIAIDRMWTVDHLNCPAQFLFGQLGIADGSTMLDLMAPDKLPPRIENSSEVAHHAAQSLRTERSSAFRP